MIMSTAPLSITLDNKTLEKLDARRGLITRSAAIQFILSEYLIKKNSSSDKRTKNNPMTKKDLMI